MRRTAALMESTLTSSSPEKVTAAVAALPRSTDAPSTCQLAASDGVPTGTDKFDGTLKIRTSL